jgi:hypothetical protein
MKHLTYLANTRIYSTRIFDVNDVDLLKVARRIDIIESFIYKIIGRPTIIQGSTVLGLTTILVTTDLK